MKAQTLFARSVARFALWACAGLLPVVGSAQVTSTWIGGGSDNNWSTSGNWSGAGVPNGDNGNNVLVFSGTSRPLTTNNLTNWTLGMGQLQFASGAASFTLSGNTFGFRAYLGNSTQQIFQNSANTQTIAVDAFSFRSDADSRISLNAGDLVISSPNMYIDASSSQQRNFTVTGSDSTRRTVTFSGNVNKGGSGNDPDMYIQANKRALVTGSLTFGSGNDGSVFIDDGVLQFSGAGTMTGGRPVIGATSGSASVAVWLDTAGRAFAQQLELRNGSSGRRTIGGLNTSGTVTFSGDFAGGSTTFDLAAATGGVTNFTGSRNFTGGLFVNRPDGVTAYGGTVILSGTTTSTDFTALEAGTLQIGDFNQIGSGHFEFNASSGDSGTLRYTGGSTTTTKTLWIDNAGITRAAIDVSQAGTTLTWNPGSGNVNQNFTKTGAGQLSFGGGITGGTVNVEQGLLVLTGSNSYSGGTTVSGGKVEVSAFGSQGGSAAGLGTGLVSVGAGATASFWLSASGSNTVTNAFSLSGGELNTIDGFTTYSGALTLASGTSTISARYIDTITLSGNRSGAGSVLFTQAGGTTSEAAPTFVLSGTGGNTGTVRVTGSSGGAATRLQLANVNALQSATLDMAAGDVGTVEFTVAGTNTYSLGGLQGSRNLAYGSNSLSVGGNGQSTTYSGRLSGSGGSLTKLGGGTLTLSGSNGITGPVDVTAGTIQMSGNGVPGGSPFGLGSGTVSIASGAQVTYWLDTSAGNTIANPFVLSGGTLHTEDGGNTFSGRIMLAGGTSAITGRYNDYQTVSGGLSGTGSVVFGQQGDSGGANAPTFLLSGTGTMTGTVRVTGSAGSAATTLMLISQQALQNATLDMAAGDTGTVDFTNGTRDIGGLMGSRDIAPTIAFLNVGGNGASTEYSGRITMGAPYNFTKTGTGSLLLSGSNGGLAGEVRVYGGRLEIGPTGSINATSGVVVSSGAEFKYNSVTPFSRTLTMGPGTLSGTGTIGTQVFLSSTTSVVSPGNSPGILTFGTSQSWSGYTYVWELNDFTTGTTAGVNFDQIAVTGSLNLTGNTYLLDITSLTAGNLPGDVGNFSDVQRSWTILTTTGGITGFDASEWTLLTNDFTTSAPLTGTWSLAQVGNDLVLTAVPEPSTCMLLAAGGGMLLAGLVRTRSKRAS